MKQSIFAPSATDQAGHKGTGDDVSDRIIRETECERISGLSRTTRWRLERSGKWPKRIQLSPNAVGWWLSEVMATLQTRTNQADA